jgi:hypothetical protein
MTTSTSGHGEHNQHRSGEANSRAQPPRCEYHRQQREPHRKENDLPVRWPRTLRWNRWQQAHRRYSYLRVDRVSAIWSYRGRRNCASRRSRCAGTSERDGLVESAQRRHGYVEHLTRAPGDGLRSRRGDREIRSGTGK